MKPVRLSVIVAALLAVATPALAQTPAPAPKGRPTLSLLFGVIHANNVAFSPGSSDLVGASGPAFNVTIDAPLRKRIAMNINFGGFTCSSTAADFSGFGTIETRTMGPEFLLRVYTADQGVSRGFIEVGPAIHFQKASVTFVPTVGPTINDDDTATKIGFIFGGGAEIPLNHRFGVAIMGDYSFVPMFNDTVDFSNVRVLGGVTIRIGTE